MEAVSQAASRVARKLYGEACRRIHGDPEGEGRASEKFWALKERIDEDKKCPGVMVSDMRRSTMHLEIAHPVLDGAITLNDLDGFTEDVTGYVRHCLEWQKRV